MKKIVSVILSIMMVFGMLCSVDFVSFAANQTEDIEKTRLGTTDTYYSFDAQTKTLTVSGTGATPDFANNNTSQPWYLWRSDGSIEHVVVEEGITSLGSYFFYYVSASDFVLPSTLESIGKYAMSGVNSLKSISLPESLTAIGDYAFYFSVGLESVTIPSAVASIGTSAFENCTSLSSVTFEDLNSNVSIGKRAFFYCPSLDSVTVPKRASLLAYSFGYYKAAAGYIYSDFVLNVYRDSPAYTYATEKIINPDNYNILNEFIISEGQSVECEYFEDSCDDEMIFIFTPDISDCYTFFSNGETETVDVDCVLCDADGAELSRNADIDELENLDFSIIYYLEAGKTYYFKVNCVSFVSIGKFNVNLINSHSYDSVVTPPTLTEDGFTTYTCLNCGYSYQADFVSRTGVLITGKVVLMEMPDGSHPHNLPIVNANVQVDGENIVLTDSIGEFEFYIDSNARELRINSAFAVDRTFEITYDENMEMDLGEISFFHYDYNEDGYVNAKDFAVLRTVYGEYSADSSEILITVDYNQDGIIDYEDFKYAQSFFAYGKISESIYE